MKKLKGCFNEKCIAYEKREKYNEDYSYCPKCGEKLKYVCRSKKCYTLLDEPLHIYCDACLKRKAEQKEDIKNNAKEVINIAPKIATIGPIVAKGAKQLTKLKK